MNKSIPKTEQRRECSNNNYNNDGKKKTFESAEYGESIGHQHIIVIYASLQQGYPSWE